MCFYQHQIRPVQEHFLEGKVRIVRHLDVDALGFEELDRTPSGWPA